MLKKVVSLLLVVVLSVCMISVSAYAVDLEPPIGEIEIEEYETINRYEFNLSRLNNKASIILCIYGISNTHFQGGTLKLYKYENDTWTAVKTWRNLASSTSTFSFSDNSVAVQSGVQYKVKISITAYTSSTSENIVLQTTKTW